MQNTLSQNIAVKGQSFRHNDPYSDATDGQHFSTRLSSGLTQHQLPAQFSEEELAHLFQKTGLDTQRSKAEV